MIGVKVEGRTGDMSDFVSFSIEDVNYITVMRKSNDQIPIYHTTHGSYALLNTLKDIAAAYAAFGFRQMDKSKVVNGKRIKRVIRSEGELKIVFVDNLFTIISPRSRYK